MTPDERAARARLAAAKRHHPSAEATQQLAGKFKTDRLSQHIQRVLESAPPLTAHQLERLTLLLRGAA